MSREIIDVMQKVAMVVGIIVIIILVIINIGNWI